PEEDHGYHPEMALRTFGKLQVETISQVADLDEPTLNAAQKQAVEHGVNHQLSFLWGPPGTGKTTTLARLITRILEQERRILVVSNTNTAIDQVLAHLKRAPETAELAAQGKLLRLGQTEPDEPCALGNVVKASYRSLVEELVDCRNRRAAVQERLGKVAQAVVKLHSQVEPEQLDLFGGGNPGLERRELREILDGQAFDQVVDQPAEEQLAYLDELSEKLQQELTEAKARVLEIRQTLKESRESVAKSARVVFSTLANLSVHPLLEGATFDTVVIEEAGMAVLPAVFLAASRASQQVIVVGDPRQLPSILSSRNQAARRILGRSIFEVTVPDPSNSPLVSMLDTQYRMAPEIGELVSRLFYEGNLKNADSTGELADKTGREPFPGRGVTVVDLAGKSTCQRPPNSKSRYNEESAEVAVAIARKALGDGVEDIAIITPYREQVRVIERLLRADGLDDPRVTCSTVHRFQGHERELVVVDTVDAPPLEPGHLLCDQGINSASAQLLNVSISRARAKLILLAEFKYLATRPTGVLGDLLRQAVKGGQVVRVAVQKRIAPKDPVAGTGTRSDWD
ncbi:MAG: DNA2/NAM7 family helicase, partial [Candidatus Eremiobacteraeota bacterium]|nr:DNA2/NAM7 family helicase [Candidatus Eremiobacteraeota bacterium]